MSSVLYILLISSLTSVWKYRFDKPMLVSESWIRVHKHLVCVYRQINSSTQILRTLTSSGHGRGHGRGHGSITLLDEMPRSYIEPWIHLYMRNGHHCDNNIASATIATATGHCDWNVHFCGRFEWKNFPPMTSVHEVSQITGLNSWIPSTIWQYNNYCSVPDIKYVHIQP